MIVPEIIQQEQFSAFIFLKKISISVLNECSDFSSLNLHCKPTVVQNGNDQNHER